MGAIRKIPGTAETEIVITPADSNPTAIEETVSLANTRSF